MSYKISNAKNRPLLIGGIIGFVFSLILIAVVYICDWSFRIPDDGSYTSEAVMLCLIPYTPSIIIAYLAHLISLDSYFFESSIVTTIFFTLFFFIFHFAFYTFIGAGIGWIISRVKLK